MVKLFFWDVIHRPELFVTTEKEPVHRLALAAVLMRGEEVNRYRGMARCRMPGCNQGLGSVDLKYHGYLWPKRCEHYVLDHGVWVPGCDMLLGEAIKALRTLQRPAS